MRGRRCAARRGRSGARYGGGRRNGAPAGDGFDQPHAFADVPQCDAAAPGGEITAMEPACESMTEQRQGPLRRRLRDGFTWLASQICKRFVIRYSARVRAVTTRKSLSKGVASAVFHVLQSSSKVICYFTHSMMNVPYQGGEGCAIMMAKSDGCGSAFPARRNSAGSRGDKWSGMDWERRNWLASALRKTE